MGLVGLREPGVGSVGKSGFSRARGLLGKGFSRGLGLKPSAPVALRTMFLAKGPGDGDSKRERARGPGPCAATRTSNQFGLALVPPQPGRTIGPEDRD
eukprot:1272559-Heterocapsa_arctica.AAC.1